MSFCPKCSYSLDIVKSKVVDDTEEKTERKKLSSVSSAIKELLENKLSLDDVEAKFSIESLKKNPRYKKLSNDEKNKMLELFEQSGGSIGAELKCMNCSYRKKLSKTTKLHQEDYRKSTRQFRKEDYYLLVNNPILSRTRDYTCKNSECPTHKDSSKKEAVFFKNLNELQVNYICSVCYFGWLI